jgi:hypothetical protein
MKKSSGKSITFGGTVPVCSHKSCVVYDSNSGRVHHVHHFITLEEGGEPSEQEVGDEAISLLAESGVHGPHLKVLHVQPDAMKAGTFYAVDCKSLKLVEQRAGVHSEERRHKKTLS